MTLLQRARKRQARCSRLVGAILALCAIARVASAYPVTAFLTADADNSNMTVTMSVPSLSLSDTDDQGLAGSIIAEFDFGTTGAFPTTADVTVLAAVLEPEAAFQFTLGFPPLFGVNVTISDALATVTTPNPPASMTRTADPTIEYEFDASSLLITIDEGMVVATGLVNDSINLAEEPVSGFPDPGELTGKLTFTPQGMTGPYTLVAAELELPIALSDMVQAGTPPTNVNVSVAGTLHASGSFYVALAGVPGDFDGDGDVDEDNLPAWIAGFGMAAGADPADGDADGDHDVDGGDFLIWQRNLGLAPPSIPATGAAASVPELGTAGVMLTGLAASAGLYRNRRRRR